MVDIVVNHFGWAGDPANVEYDKFTPFNSESYYHPYCDVSAPGANITTVSMRWTMQICMIWLTLRSLVLAGR
jgi:alpha-amylase